VAPPSVKLRSANSKFRHSPITEHPPSDRGPLPVEYARSIRPGVAATPGSFTGKDAEHEALPEPGGRDLAAAGPGRRRPRRPDHPLDLLLVRQPHLRRGQ